jgi:hypothetical protein
MAAGWWWPAAARRRSGGGGWVPGEAAPGDWPPRRQWWGAGQLVNEEVAPVVRRARMRWRRCVRKRLDSERKWGGHDRKIVGRLLTDEYREVVALNPTPCIFVGAATSPMNICGLYSSVMWLHR